MVSITAGFRYFSGLYMLAHKAREAIELIVWAIRDFIPATLGPVINPMDYKVWSVLTNRVYRKNSTLTFDLAFR